MKWFLRILGGLILVLGLGYLVADYVVNLKIRENFDKELADIADRVAVEYEFFHYNLLSGKGKATGIMATPVDSKVRVLMDELIVHEVKRDSSGDFATRLLLEGRGIRIHEKDEFGRYQPGIRSLGYDDPELSMMFGFEYDPEQQVLKVDPMELGGEEMGALKFDTEFSGFQRIDAGTLKGGNPLQQLMALGALKFHRAGFVYEDAGLVDRYLEEQAEKAGISREQLVEGMARAMRGYSTVRLPEATVAVMENFLRDPERICILAEPSKPVGKEQLGLTLLLRGNLYNLFGIRVTN